LDLEVLALLILLNIVFPAIRVEIVRLEELMSSEAVVD
jgi:hypothetical protein